MNLASLWRVLPSTERLGGVIVVLCCCLPALMAQGDPQLQFVKILPATPGVYGPPSQFGSGDMIGLRIAGLPSKEELELRVYGLVNCSPDCTYEKNETVQLVTLRTADLRKQNVAKDAAELIVPLSGVDTHGALEVTARLVGKNGTPFGAPAKLTLDPAVSVQAGPSLLQKAMATGSALVERLMTIYEVVREDPEPRLIFSVSLQHGKPTSAPVILSSERAQFRFLALSPEGKRLAWVIAEPGRYDLWISNLEKMAPVKIVSSGEEIVTPRFADETLLLYITGSTLMLVSSEKPKRSQAVWLPFRSVTRIDRAQRNRDHIECIVSAEHPDTPAFNFPYLASISVSDGGTAVFRLPVNPFYQSYSLLEEGAPFFFAGSEEGVEGIHYFQLDAPDGRVNTLWRGHSPGLVALAANGSRLVFAGNP